MSIKDRTLLRVGVEDGRCLLELTDMGRYVEVLCRNPVWQSGCDGEVAIHIDTMLIDPALSVGVSKAIRTCKGNGNVVQFDLYGPQHLASGQIMWKKPLYWLMLTPNASANNAAEPFYFLLEEKDANRLKRIFTGIN